MSVIDRDFENYINSILNPFTGRLGELQETAYTEGFPVIKNATARFLATIIALKRPEKILEIGCCIGFSASLMSEFMAGGGHITTIDRYDIMIDRAKQTFKEMELEKKITLLEGDALEILSEMDEKFDLIFMDAAKGQYIQFLPHCVRMLNKGGALIADDIFQNGYIAMERQDIPRRQRTTYTRMRRFLHSALNSEGLVSTIIPVDDGLLLSTKTADEVILKELDYDE